MVVDVKIISFWITLGYYGVGMVVIWPLVFYEQVYKYTSVANSEKSTILVCLHFIYYCFLNCRSLVNALNSHEAKCSTTTIPSISRFSCVPVLSICQLSSPRAGSFIYFFPWSSLKLRYPTLNSRSHLLLLLFIYFDVSAVGYEIK